MRKNQNNSFDASTPPRHPLRGRLSGMSQQYASQTDCAEIIDANLSAPMALCRRFGVRRLDLFGSAATGRFDPAHSDLDFLVEFEPMPPSPYAKACRGLREGLEVLFGRPIDLLAEPSLVNPYLRRQIESEKRTLYPPS
jgi:predicted nucleotidyltransferase